MTGPRSLPGGYPSPRWGTQDGLSPTDGVPPTRDGVPPSQGWVPPAMDGAPLPGMGCRLATDGVPPPLARDGISPLPGMGCSPG